MHCTFYALGLRTALACGHSRSSAGHGRQQDVIVVRPAHLKWSRCGNDNAVVVVRGVCGSRFSAAPHQRPLRMNFHHPHSFLEGEAIQESFRFAKELLAHNVS